MKIALLTIWRVKNYGAELQTYATIKTLQELGHDICVIDFRLQEPVKRKSFLGRILDIAHNLSLENLKFLYFWNKYIPSTRYYSTYEELKNTFPDADLYLVGSDQVWNPQITKEKAEAYFLNFVPNSRKLAAYASSFGTDKWIASKELTKIASSKLSFFKGIGCREKQGVDILLNQFSLNAINVLDPTLLRKSYKELIGKVKIKKTLAYYQLYDSSILSDFALKKADEMGLHFIDVNHRVKLTPTFTWNRRSVQQWIKSIAESSFVITHSFHGVAMCLIHHRPFVVIYENGDRISRIASLLDIVDLRCRLFTSIDSASASCIWNEEIDWSRVDELLEEQRIVSIDYLRQITRE